MRNGELIMAEIWEELSVIEKNLGWISKIAVPKICLRCGVDKKIAKREALLCNVYGTTYKKHLYKS